MSKKKIYWGNFGGVVRRGRAKKGVAKLFGGSKKWWEFFGGSQQFWGGEFFRKNLKKKNPRGGDSLEIVKKKFRGGRIQGDVCGGMPGNKRQDRGKKISGGQKFWGNFWGKCKKRGGTTFGGSVGGPVNPNKF